MGKLKVPFALVLLLVAMIPVCAAEIQSCALCHQKIVYNFTRSLHYTVRGIVLGWKEGPGKDLNLPVPKSCLKCHIENCSVCHVLHGYIPNETVCLKCHKIIGEEYMGYYVVNGVKIKAPNPDIHFKYHLTCLDCHRSADIHGNGKEYNFAFNAVQVSCAYCHMNSSAVVHGIRPKQYNPNLRIHAIHRGIVSCIACHSSWYVTCVNCHLKTGKVDKVNIHDFYLLRGPDGKLYPAYKMTVIYGNKSFTYWSIIFPHTITAKGRNCNLCHGNNDTKVFGVYAKGRAIGPNGTTFAYPPAKLVVRVPIIGIKIDIGWLGTFIIACVLVGICLHYLKRRITMGGE